jgi:hypothetical protein
MGPNIDASLYWLAEDAEFSFTRVCQYLLARGLATSDDIVATADDVVASRGASFITASQGRPKVRKSKTHSPPGRLGVYYSPISADAAEHGDHPAIELSWEDFEIAVRPGRVDYLPRWGIRDYRFFTHLCAQLSPLYANLTGEDWVPCAYDALHGSYPPRLDTFFCQDALLGADSAAFWATYAYTEQVGSATYGTDYLWWSPRKWTAGRESVAVPRASQEARKTLFLAALKHAYRDHWGKGHHR